MRQAFAIMSVIMACADHELGTYNTAPSVSIVTPVDGTQTDGGSILEFKGIAQDSQDAAEELIVSWSSNIDGELAEGGVEGGGEEKIHRFISGGRFS